MSYWIKALGIGLSTAVMVQMFYYVFKTSWPTSYSSVTSELDAHHRRGVVRFMTVRALPILVASAAAAHIANALHADRPVAVIAFIALHLLTTDAGVLLRSRRLAAPRFAYHLAASAGLLATAVTGLALEPAAPWAFTEPAEFVKAFWTAALTALIGGAYLKMSANSSPDPYDIDWIKRDVGPVWDQVPEIARRADADIYLIQSILAAEALQRPRWFRRIERLLPFARTLGIAQVKRAGRASDEASVEALCKNFSGYYPERSAMGYISRAHLLECRLENHNSSAAFISDVQRFMSLLQPSLKGSNNDFPPAYDNFPSIFVSSARRCGSHIQLRGTSAGLVGQLDLYDSLTGHVVAAVHLGGKRGRTPWSVRVPIELAGVRIRHQMPSGTMSDKELVVPFDYLDAA